MATHIHYAKPAPFTAECVTGHNEFDDTPITSDYRFTTLAAARNKVAEHNDTARVLAAKGVRKDRFTGFWSWNEEVIDEWS